MTDTYFKNGTIGGTATDLDGVDGDDLSDGARAIVVGIGGHYKLDATKDRNEVDPFIISPDANAGLKRWVLYPDFGGIGIYDFAQDGGAVSSIVLGSLVDNATITRAWYEVITGLTSGGAATVGFGVISDDALGILGATAYDNAAFNVGYHDALPDGTAALFTTKTTAVRNIVMTIAGANITAGQIVLHWEYGSSF